MNCLCCTPKEEPTTQCFFCKKFINQTRESYEENTNPSALVFYCSNCHIYYYYFQSNLIAYQFNLHPYKIEISNKQCVLIKNHKDIFVLDYLPKINPTNAKQWLYRFLKLIPFS